MVCLRSALLVLERPAFGRPRLQTVSCAVSRAHVGGSCCPESHQHQEEGERAADAQPAPRGGDTQARQLCAAPKVTSIEKRGRGVADA
jgi:hypothetical protein